MSKVKTVLGLAVILILGACGSEKGRLDLKVTQNSGVYGRWGGMSDVQVTDGSVERTIVIQSGTWGMEAKCKLKNGQTIYASTKVDAEITRDRITVSSTKRGENEVNGSRCYVEVRPFSLRYSVSGDRLTLEDELELKRL